MCGCGEKSVYVIKPCVVPKKNPGVYEKRSRSFFCKWVVAARRVDFVCKNNKKRLFIIFFYLFFLGPRPKDQEKSYAVMLF